MKKWLTERLGVSMGVNQDHAIPHFAENKRFAALCNLRSGRRGRGFKSRHLDQQTAQMRRFSV